MKRWGIVLAALLLTAGCALADDSGFGLDNERAQAVYWEYSGAVIEDYAEIETAGRTFAFILFKQEQRRMVKVYFDSEFGWTDWFVTAEGVPQGGRGRLETDGGIRHDFGGGRERRPADDHLRMGRGDAERAEGHGGGPETVCRRFQVGGV